MPADLVHAIKNEYSVNDERDYSIYFDIDGELTDLFRSAKLFSHANSRTLICIYVTEPINS